MLVVVFAALAWLQVRWSREIADATSVRMHSNLQTSVVRFREDFYRELSTLSSVFQGESRPDRDPLAYYARRFSTWRRSASDPALVSGVYLWTLAGSAESLRALNALGDSFSTAQWPDNLSRVHEALDVTAHAAHHGPGGLSGNESARPNAASHPSFEALRPGPPRGLTWFMAEDVPALVGRVDDNAGRETWAIIVLDRSVLTTRFLPELVQRYFGTAGQLDYHVAILNVGDPTTVFYDSEPGAPIHVDRADAMSNMFGPIFAPGSQVAPPDRKGNTAAFQRGAGMWMPRFESLRYTSDSRGWVLVAQHRKGSLEAAVDRLHYRNLAISFGVSLVLAGAIVFMFISTQRARRLAQMQMDFVAAVSHELRTPLAVISTAAENIADGVVDNKAHLARYGRVIKGQARQLIDLIEQILLFASSQQHHAQYNIQDVSVDSVIETVVAATAETVRSANFRLELSSDGDLPHVLCDPVALSHVLQNLITNAVKYGGEARWIGLSARHIVADSRPEVRISVSDRGVGISEEEVGRIFEPFYRSRSATAAQIRGTGLGLSVARAMTEAMHGKLNVISEPGRGSTFTVSLPAQEYVAPAAPESARVESKVS